MAQLLGARMIAVRRIGTSQTPAVHSVIKLAGLSCRSRRLALGSSHVSVSLAIVRRERMQCAPLSAVTDSLEFLIRDHKECMY